MLKVGCLSIGFPNFRYDIAQQNLDKTLAFLSRQEIELTAYPKVLITEEEISQALAQVCSTCPDVLLLELGTYSYGSALMTCLEQLRGAHLVLWAFREPIVEGFTGMPLNSLCALNMYTSFLKRMGKDDFSYLYGGAEEPLALQKLETVLKAAAIKKELRQARFCIVGGRVPGFYLSNVDELRFHNEIGPELVYYSIACLLKDAAAVTAQEAEAEAGAFTKLVSRCSASQQSLLDSARIYIALRRFAQANHITGYALKCWPDFQELMDVAVCGVVSRLNNEGLLTSCEGDVTGLATMFIQSRLSSSPVFLTDLVNVTEDGTVKLWHCGSAAPALAEDTSTAAYTSHPTMKHIPGVAAELGLRTGQVTVCKLSEDKPYKMLVVEGECIRPDRVLTGNQGDIRPNCDSERLLQLIVQEGIEHHYSVAYDCDVQVLYELGRLMGMRILTAT